MRQSIPTLGLAKTKKEKLGMYVQDFHIIHSAHWKYDEKALHGYIRVSEDLAMLLSVATATRPAALVEGAAAKGTNKVLCWEHALLMKVSLVTDPGRSTILALVDLVHVKNAEGNGRKLVHHALQASFLGTLR